MSDWTPETMLQPWQRTTYRAPRAYDWREWDFGPRADGDEKYRRARRRDTNERVRFRRAPRKWWRSPATLADAAATN